MKRRLSLYICTLVLLFSSSANAQDPAFSQFYAAPLFLNPAMAGGYDYMQVSLNSRMNLNQNLYFYSLNQGSFIYPIKLENQKSSQKYFKNGYVGGVGLTVYNEIIGNDNKIKAGGASATASYFTQLSMSHFLAFGLQLGVIQKTVSLRDMSWGSQYDPDLGYNSSLAPSVSITDERTIFPTANFGLTWYHNLSDFNPYVKTKFRIFSGFAMSNVNKPDESFIEGHLSELPVLLKFHGGLSIPVSSNFEILPNYLVLNQAGQTQVNLGGYLAYYLSGNSSKDAKFYQIQLGNWYRLGDSYILSLGVEMQNYSFGISYDMNVSPYNFKGKGVRTVEISLSFRTSREPAQQKRRVSHPII